MGYTYSCRAPAPPIADGGATVLCGRPAGHRGVHVAYAAKGREVDTWPRFEDVVALKRENGTL